jgi:hypothetical protein
MQPIIHDEVCGLFFSLFILGMEVIVLAGGRGSPPSLNTVPVH